MPSQESARLPKIQATHLDASLSGLSSESILTEAHTVFTLIDRNSTGTLDMEEVAELRRCLKKMHPDRYPHPLTPGIADQIVGKVMDRDGNGVVDFQEFCFVCRGEV